jgi:predicted amidophosphoribosyltransferase
MKKCPGCQRELDKYGLACQYCGKVEEVREKEKKVKKPLARLRSAKRL